MRLRDLCLLASAACLLAPGSAHAANTYVDEDRPDNSGNCLTPATACKTIGGATGGLAKAGAGDTAFVDGGSYAESLVLGLGKSLVYQEFGAADGPAVIDGQNEITIEVIDGATAGTVQGLTIRGGTSGGGSLRARGPVTVTGNTFDEDDGALDDGSLHLEDDATHYVVTGNTFVDPVPSDDVYGLRAVLSGTALLSVNDNQFTGFQEGIYATATPKRPAEFKGNTFTGIHPRNDESSPGMGMHLDGIQAFLERNTMSSPGPNPGGSIGVSATNGSLTLYRNRIRDHTNGVNASCNTFATLNGDVLWNNGVGVFVNDCLSDDPVDIKSSVLWNNSFADVHMLGGEVNIDSSILSNPISKAGSATTPFLCTIVFSRGATTAGADPDGCDGFQTSADPAFVNPSTAVADFHLTQGSPMVDAGNPGMSTFMVFDPDDDPRTLDGNCDGTTRPDIGADELLRDCTPGIPPGGGPGGPAGGGGNPSAKPKCKKGRKLKKGKCVKKKRKKRRG